MNRSALPELLSKAAVGDIDAMALAFQEFRPHLKQAIQMRIDARLGGRFDPSDVVQEAFLDARRRFAEFVAANNMPLFIWLRLLVEQRLVDLHRQHLGTRMRDAAALEISLDQPVFSGSAELWLSEQLLDRYGTGSSVAARTELRKQVLDALQQISPVDREILAMRHFEQLSNQEIAQSLGISPTAASNRYIRALRRLRSCLSIDDEAR